MMLNYILLTLFLSLILTFVVMMIATKLKIVDKPVSNRKIHKIAVPLLGGTAIFLSFFITIFLIFFLTDHFRFEYIKIKHLAGIFIGGMILILGGYLDDKYNLPAKKQIIFPILAIFCVIVSGIGIRTLTNPLGGYLMLDQIEWTAFYFQGIPYRITLIADIFTILWLMGMMYTTKLLDGLDGLVSGITIIASVLLTFVSLSKYLQQEDTALMAMIFGAAVLGFLIFNFHPAKVFLGEGGALFLGFMLGVLAIIAGGKITTALLVMGIPILDVVWVIGRRIIKEKKSPFKFADKKHLHHRLLDVGFSHRSAVIFYYFLAASFGSLILLIQGKQKVLVLGGLIVFMVILGMILVEKYRRKEMS